MSGVFSVRQENEREGQGEGYMAVVRPPLVYGAEKLALNRPKAQGDKASEERMLRRMRGVTKLGKIINEIRRGQRKSGKSQTKSSKGG